MHSSGCWCGWCVQTCIGPGCSTASRTAGGYRLRACAALRGQLVDDKHTAWVCCSSGISWLFEAGRPRLVLRVVCILCPGQAQTH